MRTLVTGLRAGVCLAMAMHVGVASAASVVDKGDKVRGAVMGAMVADALCLGSHYEYDAPKIKKATGGPIERYYSPGENMGGETHGIGWGQRNYHPGKKAGGNTDSGDGVLYLLEYFSAAHKAGNTSPFSVQHYVDTHWLKQYKGYEQGTCRACGAWIDSATKTALSNLARGVPLGQAGSGSNAQVVRFVPALAVYSSEQELISVARSTTEFTNRNPHSIGASDFWARTVWRVLEGQDPAEAMEKAAAALGDHFISEKVTQALAKVKEASDPASQLAKEEFTDDLALTSMSRLWDVGKSEPIKVGKASPVEGALPGAVYLIAKYKDFKLATQANAMVGGDNAARSIPIGMVLGAFQGMQGIPPAWLDTLTEGKHASALLETLPLARLTPPTATPEL